MQCSDEGHLSGNVGFLGSSRVVSSEFELRCCVAKKRVEWAVSVCNILVLVCDREMSLYRHTLVD